MSEDRIKELEAELKALKKKGKNARHSKKDPNWCTPTEYALMNYTVMGKIGFDPFSSDIANTLVHADKYLTPKDDGFAQPWEDYTHINPPGLKVKEAWDKLCQEIVAGRVTTAMWVGFSVEQLCILADPNAEDEEDEARYGRGGFHPVDFSLVILRKRISFVRENGTEGSPSHGNYVVGVGVDHDVFEKVYGPLGRVIKGPLACGKPPCTYHACKHDQGLCFSNYEYG